MGRCLLFLFCYTSCGWWQKSIRILRLVFINPSLILLSGNGKFGVGNSIRMVSLMVNSFLNVCRKVSIFSRNNMQDVMSIRMTYINSNQRIISTGWRKKCWFLDILLVNLRRVMAVSYTIFFFFSFWQQWMMSYPTGGLFSWKIVIGAWRASSFQISTYCEKDIFCGDYSSESYSWSWIRKHCLSMYTKEDISQHKDSSVF